MVYHARHRLIPLLLIGALLLTALASGVLVRAQYPAWAPNTAYSTSSIVSYNGSYYRCRQAHTSQVGWEPPNVASLWEPTTVSTATTGAATSTRTRTNTTGTATSTRTRTNTTGTATSTRTRTNTISGPSPTRTNTISGPSPTRTRTNTTGAATSTRTRTNTSAPPTATTGSSAPAWVASRAYSLGTLVSYNGATYSCITAHTSQVGWEPPVAASLWQLQTSPPTATRTNTAIGPTATRTSTSPTGGTATAVTATRTRTNTSGPTATRTRTFTSGPGGVPSRAQAEAHEQQLTNNTFFQTVKASVRRAPNSVVEAVTPGNSNNPANVKRVEAIVTQAKWDFYFSKAHPSYTYTRFLQAVAKFPAFCGDYSDGRNANLICRRSLATMFAHFAQETGGHSEAQYGIPEWRQGLVYVREIGCTDTGTGCGYNAECADPVFNKVWTCGKDSSGAYKKYFGRGAKQLSYNYNYGPFSQAMFNGDQSVLLNDPDRVAESWLNLASAVFFFVYPQPPKPSMLHVVDGTWVPNSSDISKGLGNNFPTTIQIINAECIDNPTKLAAQNRINYYKQFAPDLGWDYTSESMACAGMGRFDATSSAAFNIFWEKTWNTGQEYQCQLVSYQTPYNALIEGQYVNCVEDNWNVTLQ